MDGWKLDFAEGKLFVGEGGRGVGETDFSWDCPFVELEFGIGRYAGGAVHAADGHSANRQG